MPIRGTERLRYLEENIAASIGLTPEVVAELDRVPPVGAVRGGRYQDMTGIEA